MNRFYSRDTMTLDPEHGQFVHYEEARQIEVDRDIKAANLQLLVEKVLAYDVTGDGDHINTNINTIADAYDAMVDLARSLKQ